MGEFSNYINELNEDLRKNPAVKSCTKPLVSVIVPAFNAEETIAKCLQSILKQSFKNIEIITVNDGSNDNSLNILKNYARKDSRIKIINKENEGLSCARNDGLNIACGEYIGYIDSDDWTDVKFYEKLYNAAKKYDADIAAGNIIRCGKLIRKYRIKYEKEKLFTDSTEKLKAAGIPKYNYVWNKIYKRESLININICFPAGKVYEDIQWSIKIVYFMKNFLTVPDCNYFYRKNQSSIVSTTKKNEKKIKDGEEAVDVMVKFAEEHNLTEILKNNKLKRKKILFYGLKVMEITEYYPHTKVYKLFGFLPVYRTRRDFC